MIKLKEIAFPQKRGFTPTISSSDIGKYVVVYKNENTLVKGTRPYDTYDEAKKILDLLSPHDHPETFTIKIIK